MAKQTLPAHLITTDGTTSQVVPENGTDFQLQELYKLLDVKFVQIIPLRSRHGYILICDEEGAINGSPPNPEATKLVKNDILLPTSGYLHGNVILCPTEMVQ